MPATASAIGQRSVAGGSNGTRERSGIVDRLEAARTSTRAAVVRSRAIGGSGVNVAISRKSLDAGRRPGWHLDRCRWRRGAISRVGRPHAAATARSARPRAAGRNMPPRTRAPQRCNAAETGRHLSAPPPARPSRPPDIDRAASRSRHIALSARAAAPDRSPRNSGDPCSRSSCAHRRARPECRSAPAGSAPAPARPRPARAVGGLRTSG